MRKLDPRPVLHRDKPSDEVQARNLLADLLVFLQNDTDIVKQLGRSRLVVERVLATRKLYRCLACSLRPWSTNLIGDREKQLPTIRSAVVDALGHHRVGVHQVW